MHTSHRKLARGFAIAALVVCVMVGATAAGAAGEPAAQQATGPDDVTVPEAVPAGEPVSVDAAAVADADDVEAVCWRFDENETCHGADATHTFEEPGMHTATLVVTDDDGDVDATTWPVVATSEPSAALAAPETATAGETVELDAGGSTDDHGIERYEWDLDGDGSIDATTESPTLEYAFDAAGTHEVTVAAVDVAGQSGRANATVDVAEADDERSGSNPGIDVGTGADGDGFGAVVAFAAALGATLVAMRRHD